jgi:hypothetical protein
LKNSLVLAAFNPVKQIGQTSFSQGYPSSGNHLTSVNSIAWITTKDPASRKVVVK